MRSVFASMVLSFAALAVPSYARTIDDQSAAELARTLSSFVSQAAFDKGIVKVVADGDAFRIDLNFEALASLFEAEDDLDIDIAPYAWRVKPLADGTWQVDGGLFPDGSLEVIQPPRQRTEWTMTDGRMTGVFDPALAGFSSASGAYAGLRVISKQDAGENEISHGAGTYSSTATKSPNGGVDFSQMQTIRDYSEKLRLKDGANNIPISTKAALIAIQGKGTGLRIWPVLDLLAFAAANPSGEKIIANQAEMKSLLRAALPVWEHMDASYAVTDLSITGPFGILRAAKAGTSVAMDGVAQDGSLDLSMQLANMEVASLFLPAWARTMIPTEVDINAGLRNLNLESAAIKAIEGLDVSRQPPIPPEVADEIAVGFRMQPPTIILSKSAIRNADIQITAEARLAFPPHSLALDATIEAAGYDKVVAAVQAAASSDPELSEAVPAMLLAKGFAKALPDGRLQWVVLANPDGSVLVNGTKVRPAKLPAQ